MASTDEDSSLRLTYMKEYQSQKGDGLRPSLRTIRFTNNTPDDTTDSSGSTIIPSNDSSGEQSVQSLRSWGAVFTRIPNWLSNGFYDFQRDDMKSGLEYLKKQNISMDPLKRLGIHVFRGAIARPYLEKYGLPSSTLDSAEWTTNGSADNVTAAILDWATTSGASHYCHWFHPLGVSGIRHGHSAQVQNALCSFDQRGRPSLSFSTKDLLFGETDGNNYPTGGLRTSSACGGYLTIDPSSPIFLRGDAFYIPAAFMAYTGHALDERTPLLRSSDALSREGVKLLGLLGYGVQSLTMQMGFELELFFVNRECYLGRTDLQMTGRTVMGKLPPRGQQLHDHYMAPISLASPVMACMQEIQEQCFKMGIPLRTRHREVAPNQYEFSPTYGPVNIRIDQDLLVMQIVQEVAICYGLTALFHEKPFQGVNGSGKHNNWSITTSDGTNLFNVARLAKKTKNREIFPLIIAALIQAVDMHGDLLQLAISCPGNELRLGGFEAPAAIVTLYLGESLTTFLIGYMNGDPEPYAPMSRFFDMGASALPPIEVPVEDRNRTSFFAYGGHRFEFRATGSSQNLSLVNTVLATILAKSFRSFSRQIEAGKTPREVAMESLKKHFRVVFNGDSYSIQNQKELISRGLWHFDSSIEAICRYTFPKNIALFEEMKVLNKEECISRERIQLELYIATVETECKCMLDMINGDVIPAVIASEVGPLKELQDSVILLNNEMAEMQQDNNLRSKAFKASSLRLITMVNVRAYCDAAEAVVPVDMWTITPYVKLLFLDHNYLHKFKRVPPM